MGSTLVSAIGFGVVLASIIAIAAMGFTIQFGLTNVLNLSFGAVMTVAAFSAYLANRHGVGGWSDLAVGGAAGAVLTLVLGRGIFKPYARRGARLFEMMMVTLGLSLIVNAGQITTPSVLRPVAMLVKALADAGLMQRNGALADPNIPRDRIEVRIGRNRNPT